MQSNRKDTLSRASEHSASGTSLAENRRSVGGVDGRGLGSDSSSANCPSVEATTATGQSRSNAELQAKLQKLEEENQQLRLANQYYHETVENLAEDLQRLKDKSHKNSKNLRQNVINYTEKQEEEIKQLREVGQFWLGLERLRHDKISQSFEGNLPNDDIVFQLAKMGLPEA